MNNPHSHVLIKSLQKQEGPNWCYSAVVQAIIKYYNNIDLPQHGIAQTVAAINKLNKPLTNKNMSCMRDPYTFLQQHGYISSTFKSKTIPWEHITSNINEGYPIIIRIAKHYAIISGYSINPTIGNQILILDPILPNGGPVAMLHSVFNKHGLQTDYEHTGVPVYERMNGYILTDRPTS